MKIVTPPTWLEWLEWRQGGIGSSDAPAVMQASPWLKREELWALKTERMLPKPGHPRMRRGRALEPLARKEYERMTGVLMPAANVEHDTLPFVLASLDGLNQAANVPTVEIKCPGREDHATALKGKVPDKYKWQCAHQLLATGFDVMDYFSYDGEVGVIVKVKRDRRLEEQLLKEETILWEHVLRDEQPKPLDRHLDDSKVFKIRRSR